MRRFILSTAFLGLATVASAQAAVGPQWSAFAGCWTPVGADGSRNIAANTPRVCIIPKSGSTADLITLVSDSVTDRTSVNADGRQQPISKQGCSGWERAEFSSDGRRLYLRGEQTCAGGLMRITSGLFAIATNGDWINTVNVGADSTNSVRVSRYAPATVTSTMPAEVRETLAGRELSDRTARVAAQREVSVNAVIEASRFVAAPSIEAWLAELDQDFKLDDKALIRLADEKVEPSVIDMMVAVSNPGVFSVKPTGTIEVADQRATERSEMRSPCFAPVVDPWAWYSYDPCDPFLRYGYYRSRYYRYGYGYGYRYGYPYGYDPYYGGYYGTPVIIVRGGAQDTERGRMTSDGYKRDGGSSSSGSSTPRSTTSSSGSSSGSSSAGSSSSGSSSSGGSSSGRTATRKPPAA